MVEEVAERSFLLRLTVRANRGFVLWGLPGLVEHVLLLYVMSLCFMSNDERVSQCFIFSPSNTLHDCLMNDLLDDKAWSGSWQSTGR